MRFVLSLMFALPPVLGIAQHAAGPASPVEDATFAATVLPFMQTYCWDCHNADTREGDLDLSGDVSPSAVLRHFRHWSVVRDRIAIDDMPPEDAGMIPDQNDRDRVLAWIDGLRDAEAKRTAGDPGIVTARRLSNAEYDATIEDLTGQPIRPAAAFPIDPTNEAGFDNSGDSLAMSPTLLKKYFQATRHVTDHLVLTPTGIDFAPHPVMTDTDRDKYCVNRIIDFYASQNTDYADYFFVLARSRTAVPSERETSIARAGLSTRYAQTLWELLTSSANNDGPVAELRGMWDALPVDAPEQDDQSLREACRSMAEWVRKTRATMVQEIENLKSPEMNDGSQPLVLWKNNRVAANRQRYTGGWVDPEGETTDPQTLQTFCRVFPDTFYVSERARTYLDAAKEAKQGRSGRLLSAGFHSQTGYYRDDAPLYDLMLSDPQRSKLDQLWLEFNFVTGATARQFSGFIWFDRTDSAFLRDREFDEYRAEDKNMVSETKLRGLGAAYSAKAKRVGADEQAIAAIDRYFDDLSKTFRLQDRLRIEAEPKHVSALVELAERAYRRPLDDRDREDIVAFYHSLRQVDGLSHEEAIRDGVVRVLMSPRFCYRVDLQAEDVSGGGEIEPLDPYSLASRLSYFLWSGMPDETLMRLAESESLSDPEVLLSQSRRMLRDARVQRFVTGFVGSWLDFRYFQQHNGVDRERFPEFTDELRQAMFEEPVRFVNDLIQRDGSIMELVDADHTFVNTALAKHYGIETKLHGDQWQRVDDAKRWQRGGLLPMAVFLTNNSPGLRTSPVKRGNWVVKRIFGEHVPAPPASVPDLPEDESLLGDLTLREALAKHREHVACAGCHERIDSFGLVFEKYGPVGEWRESDLGGRDVDSSVVFPDHSEGDGLIGLRGYLRRQRQDDFVENFCRNLLAYGLGRTLQLSDDPAIAAMIESLNANEFRIGVLFDQIVSSPAFMNRRVQWNELSQADTNE